MLHAGHRLALSPLHQAFVGSKLPKVVCVGNGLVRQWDLPKTSESSVKVQAMTVHACSDDTCHVCVFTGILLVLDLLLLLVGPLGRAAVSSLGGC